VIDFPRLDEVDIASQSISVDRTKMQGIYFLLKDGKVIYVGQSSNVMARIGVHIANPKKSFDSYSFFKVENYDDLNVIETYYIYKFDPLENKVFPSNPWFISVALLKEKFKVSKTELNRLVKIGRLNTFLFQGIQYFYLFELRAGGLI
jgi:GIY-YIG catalytic domain